MLSDKVLEEQASIRSIYARANRNRAREANARNFHAGIILTAKLFGELTNVSLSWSPENQAWWIEANAVSRNRGVIDQSVDSFIIGLLQWGFANASHELIIDALFAFAGDDANSKKRTVAILRNFLRDNAKAIEGLVAIA